MLIVSFFATTGSLFFSLGLGLIPCRLCWYQRILMYPLVVIFFFGTFYKDESVFLYTFPLSFLGLIIASYHSYIQRAGVETCSAGSSCSAIMFSIGPFSIPNLSLIAFALIVLTTSIYFLRNYETYVS